MLTMRPHFLAFISGSASWIAWNVALRLIAMMASHFSAGNSSIGATNWMPALFTRMSTLPNAALVLATRSAIAVGLLMSAPLYSTFTPNFAAVSLRSFSIAAASPKPFSMTLQPSAANASAMAWPMPLVEPVTRADLPLRDMRAHFLKKDAAADAW